MLMIIPCYFHNSSTSAMEDMELDIPLDHFEVKNVFFFDISVMYPEMDEDGNEVGTVIYASGERFITPVLTDEIFNQIKELKKNEQA